MAGSFDRPLPDSSYRKAPAPRMGNAYGAWAGREDIAFDLPGANVLQFDLSRLDLSDYRAMRDHYQINANNMVLSFMLHQQDWKIECDSEKVAKRVEENLRRIWTRLIRASSTALWAGYAPCALEWDNVNGGIEITKIKDLPPEECRVNWKTIEGYAPPGTAKPKFYEFDGINQRASTAAIPPSHSFWYPILMEHGNHYGRKLLRAAFIPWFYSQLIHLFSNRYFERFGEPLPIGRADFEAEVITTDGSTTDGRTAMNSILQSLRNRSVVTLPSDRDPDTKEFTFDIEYLESQMRGADFERYLLRLDEEISLAQFTPLLVMRAGGAGGYNQGVQHTQCVHPDTPILCADLTWRPAGTLRAGQEIVAFDDEPNLGQGRGMNARSFRTAVIEGNAPGSKPSMRISTDIGDPVIASEDHPWLVWRNRNKAKHGCRTKGLVWVETKDLVEGDQIAHFARPWKREDGFDAGWISGMFDGEGCLANSQGDGRGVELTITQVDGPVMDRAKQLLSDFGVQFTMGIEPRVAARHQTCHRIRISGGMRGAIETLGRFQPMRLVAKANKTWEDVGVRRNQTIDLATVTSIEDMGEQPIASIKTSTGTFITGGYLTHNTFLWMLNALSGDLKEYIDRYIVDRIVNYNFGENAPRAYWVPRKMGKDNVETMRSVVTELVRSGAAKVDLDELGTAIGLTLEEVEQIQQDPAQPEMPAASATETDANGDVVRIDTRTGRQRPGASGPRGVGQTRTTARNISARVRTQIEAQFRKGAFGRTDAPKMGYRRGFTDALVEDGCSEEVAADLTESVYRSMNTWMAEVVPLGREVFDTAADFSAAFERLLDAKIDALVE